MRRLLLVLLICMLPLLAWAEQAFIVEPGITKGYGDNSITVTSPAEGDLLLRVQDRYNVYRTMTFRVKEGENMITWDGLGENTERIMDDTYTLFAQLTTDDGQVLEIETDILFYRCHQAMLFALGKEKVLYQADGDWFVEMELARPGAYVIDVYHADDMARPVESIRRNTESFEAFKHFWKAKDMLPGEYILRCYAQQNPDYAYDVPVTVVEGSRPVIPLTETETFMPSLEDTDETIWRMMMQPSAVVDMKVPTAHQEIYLQPDEASRVLGTIHAQSQAVRVMDIREGGWVRVQAWNHESGALVEGYVQKERLVMVQPNDQCGLLLDKGSQTLTIFYQGKRLTTLKVSTGRMEKDALFQETPAGSYLTLEHISDFATGGLHYDYPIRYDGGNLLHQLGYKERNGRNDFTQQSPQLGSKASHGCVRLPFEVNEDGVNAYWLWTHLPYHTRVMILDDPLQRMEHEALANAGMEEMPDELDDTYILRNLKVGQTEIVVTLGGDAVLGTREAWWKEPESLPAYLEKEGMAYPFSGLKEIFTDDDMTLVNLECVLKADSTGEDKEKQYRFRGLPEYTEALKVASVDQVNIANNHYIDYDVLGKKATREALDAAGIPFSGQGYTYVWDCKGRRIGFAGCRETTYKQDENTIANDIAALREGGCEVIIYSCHWGTEYSALHNSLQEEMARAAAEAGADVVVGTHPHVVQGVEDINGTVVLYSLGNLMFGGTHDMTTFDGTLAQLRLRFDHNGYLGCGVELIPVLTSSSVPYNDFRPMVAEGDDKLRIMTKMQIDSNIQLREKMWFPVE